MAATLKNLCIRWLVPERDLSEIARIEGEAYQRPCTEQELEGELLHTQRQGVVAYITTTSKIVGFAILEMGAEKVHVRNVWRYPLRRAGRPLPDVGAGGATPWPAHLRSRAERVRPRARLPRRTDHASPAACGGASHRDGTAPVTLTSTTSPCRSFSAPAAGWPTASARLTRSGRKPSPTRMLFSDRSTTSGTILLPAL